MNTSKSDRNVRRAKFRTNKILDRITFNPPKHKNKVKRMLRTNLQQREQRPPPPAIQSPPSTLTFGSINVNGLDLEAGWAVEQLLVTRGFDVSIYYLISQ